MEIQSSVISVAEEPTAEQPKSRHDILEEEKVKNKAQHLAPYQFKKGQSGNPNGRPPGKSLKERAKVMLQSMTEEEEQEFLNGIDKRIIWEMAEGKARQDIEHAGAITISHVLDSLENDIRQEIVGQGLENEPLVQNQEQGAEVSEVQQEQGPSTLQQEQVVSQPDPEIPPVGIYNG